MPAGLEIFGGLVSLVVYGVVIFAVYKVFQMAGDMSEIKEILRDIRRNTEDKTFHDAAPHSAESLVRAVNAASYSELVEPSATHSEPPR